MKNVKKTRRRDFITYGMVIAAYIVMMVLIQTDRITNALQGQLVPICVYICMAVSLNLVVGILGDLSLGHAGFMSVGAFTGIAVSMSLQNTIPDGTVRLILAIAVGAVMAAIAGILVGVPVLRLRGDYLAIVTLAFGEIIKNIITNLYVGVDGGGIHFSFSSTGMGLAADGTTIIKGAQGAVGVTKLATFTAGFILILVTLFIVFNLVNSRTGRAIKAIRDNRIAAESVGINITKYKLIAFVVSAALAGMAGALYGLNYSGLKADKFNFNTSILVLVFVVLGGIGSMRGSIIAATVLTVLPETLRALQDYRMLIYAIILIVMMIVTNNPLLRSVTDRAVKKLKAPFVREKTVTPAEGGDGNG